MTTQIKPIAFPSTDREIPRSFEFPRGQRVVSLGYDNSDICLQEWDSFSNKKKERLYSPHIQFHYIPAPLSQWHILSLRGFRRGSKSVFVSDKHIYSAHGLVPILENSSFSVGNFYFTFCPDTAKDLEDFENPAHLVSTLENDMKCLVNTLSIPLPDSVYSAEEKSIDWDRVYFSQLLNWISKNPDIKPLLVSIFGSMKAVKDCVSFLVNIRNKVFHPSKGCLEKVEKEQLSVIYLRFRDVANRARHQMSTSAIGNL